MRYKGRTVDPIQFWNRYIEIPSGVRVDDDAFLPKAQCPNPEHDTLKKHFQVNAHEPYVHCFAHCGISGSWEHAICIIEGLYEKFKVDLSQCRSAWDKQPAKRSLGERDQLRRYQRAHREASRIILRASGGKIGIAEKPQIKKSTGAKATKVISSSTLEYESFLPQIALEYLKERGITQNSIATWNLGWLSDEKRIAIPARDENNVLKFLIKRAVLPTQNPKYLYTEGFPKTALLFGAGQIDLSMIKSHGLGLVEGSIDTIVQHQHGLKFFGGILGTGISDQQCRIIARFRPRRIYFFFDKDSAGIVNIEIAASKLRKYPTYVIRYPKGKSDPAEVTEKEAWRQLERAMPLQKFITKTGLSIRSRRKNSEINSIA